MKINRNKIIALAVSVMMFSTITAQGYAAQKNVNETESDIIEKATGTRDINSDFYSTTKNVVIADGEETIIKIPRSGNRPVDISDGEDQKNNISIGLPEEIEGIKGAVTDNGTVVYVNNKKDVTVGVQSLTEKTGDNNFEGVRALITIKDKTAPRSYDFTYDLPKGSKLVSSKQYMGNKFDTGEVYVVNGKNEITAVIEPAWAKDAKGKAVKTCYKISGNKLTQVIKFHKNTAFPVVADPSLWKVAKCVGAIVWVVGSAVFSVAKILRIKRYVKAIGGFKKAATLIMKSGRKASKAKLMSMGGKALMGLAAEILGITTVKDNCF